MPHTTKCNLKTGGKVHHPIHQLTQFVRNRITWLNLVSIDVYIDTTEVNIYYRELQSTIEDHVFFKSKVYVRVTLLNTWIVKIHTGRSK